MDELVQLFAKTYGILGLILISPFVAMVHLWKDNLKLREDLKTANAAINETHGKRVDDSKAVSEKLLAMVQEHSELSKETNMALERVGDFLTQLQNTTLVQRALAGIRPRKRSSSHDGEEDGG